MEGSQSSVVRGVRRHDGIGTTAAGERKKQSFTWLSEHEMWVKGKTKQEGIPDRLFFHGNGSPTCLLGRIG